MSTRLRSIALALLLFAGAPFCLSAELALVGPELAINADEAYSQRSPTALYAPDGSFTVIWENERYGLRGRRFDAQGLPQGADLDLVPHEGLPSIPGKGPVTLRSQPVAAALPTGDFFLVWTEEQAILSVYYFHQTQETLDRDIYGQRFDAEGRPQGPRFRINTRPTGLESYPVVAYHPTSGLLVAWEGQEAAGEPHSVFIRRLSAEGQPRGRQRRLSSLEDARQPAVAAAPDGSFLVAWQACCGDGDGDGVFAQLLSPSADPVGGSFQVNSTTTGLQRRPSVASNQDGQFLIAWQGRYQSNRQARIFGQVVAADGTFLGPELRISEGRGNVQIAPELAPSGNGGYSVVWLDWNDNFPIGVFGVQLDAFGNPLDDELRLSTAQVGAQFGVGLAVTDSGELLVTWEGFHGDELGVSAQRVRSAQEAEPQAVGMAIF